MRPARLWLLAFSLLIPGICSAISLYDVIQLSKAKYSDSRIIELIQTTNSRFQLDAEAVINLKQAGVSEKVIKAIIEASEPRKSDEGPSPQEELEREPSETPADHQHTHQRDQEEENSETSSGHQHQQEHEAVKENAEHSLTSPSALPEKELKPVPALSPSGPFGFFAFEEVGAGHGSPHQHCAVSINEVGIFVLRGESGFRTVSDRAGQIADLLNRVVNTPDGRFFASGEPDPAVWYRPKQGGDLVRILPATSEDVIAYQRRSLGRVSAFRLAAYWAALLNDYAQLFLFGRPPTELVHLHLGETLSRIYRDLSSPEKEENDDESSAATVVSKVLDHLTADDKDHLIELAIRVPLEFQEKSEVPQ